MVKRCRILLTLMLASVSASSFGDQPPYTSEMALRAIAIKRITPIFPAEALHAIKAAGVAVAYVTFSEKGEAIDVTVLESPHPSISSSLVAALKEWKIRPGTIAGKPSKVAGKITFYYLVERGVGRVANPEDVGAVDLSRHNGCKADKSEATR